jgi:uncharacterized protein (TIGR03437 family)
VLPSSMTVPDTPTVVVSNSDGSTTAGTFNLVPTSAGIFTATGTGQGTAAALVTSDGINYTSVALPDGSPRPVSAGTQASPSFLTLFVTGLGNAPSPNSPVSVTIGNATANVVFAGPQGQFPGLSQINVVIPPTLAGANIVGITVTTGMGATLQTSNLAQINIQ